MPLFRRIECKEGWGGIWEITETFETLCSMLPNHDYHQSYAKENFKSSKRQLEYIVTRVLLTVLCDKKTEIGYYLSGRPYLKGSKINISISHTSNYVAVLLSDSYVPGIDIELIADKVQRLKSRIIGPLEYAETTVDILTHWCAKETAFKILDLKGLDFIENMTVETRVNEASGKNTNPSVYTLRYNLNDGTGGLLEITRYTYANFVMTYSFMKKK